MTSYIVPLLIQHPLDIWINKPHQSWLWYEHGDNIYGPNNQTYSLASSSTRQLRYLPSPLTHMPPNSVPVDIHFQDSPSLIELSAMPLHILQSPLVPSFDYAYLQYHQEFMRQGVQGIVKYLKKR